MDPGNPYYLEPPPGPRRRSGLNPGVVAFLVVLIGALGVYGIVLLADSGDDDGGETTTGGRSGTNATTTTTTRSTTTTTTGFEVGSSELPEAMVGSWGGTVTQDSSETSYDTDITLHLADAEGTVGEVEYPTLDCSGHYTLEEVTNDAVFLIEHITDGLDRCLDGVEIKLRFVDADEIFYSFENAGNPEDGTGTLVRTSGG